MHIRTSNDTLSQSASRWLIVITMQANNVFLHATHLLRHRVYTNLIRNVHKN